MSILGVMGGICPSSECQLDCKPDGDAFTTKYSLDYRPSDYGQTPFTTSLGMMTVWDGFSWVDALRNTLP